MRLRGGFILTIEVRFFGSNLQVAIDSIQHILGLESRGDAARVSMGTALPILPAAISQVFPNLIVCPL
jgi:hypothetical protein